MDNTSRILTWRAPNKRGSYVLKEHYDLLSEFIFRLLKERKVISLNELIEETHRLSSDYRTDLTWTLLQVKADLETKHLISIGMMGPHHVQVITRHDRRRGRIIYAPRVDKDLL